jgi:hypothetical protein
MATWTLLESAIGGGRRALGMNIPGSVDGSYYVQSQEKLQTKAPHGQRKAVFELVSAGIFLRVLLLLR